MRQFYRMDTYPGTPVGPTLNLWLNILRAVKKCFR